ncbi:MAG: hypothetical protein FJ128_12895 [Deltaproteobacteria bacterium]|nr:hypothetical protein [Deltaproteobacteria bacterium]
MHRRRWWAALWGGLLAGLLVWPGHGLLFGQTKGTGTTGGITGETGSTGATRDIEDEPGTPGTFHPKTSPFGWGKNKGKPPQGSAKQGWRGLQSNPSGSEMQTWAPKGSRSKTKPGPEAAADQSGLQGGQPETPPPHSPKGPKGPKGPSGPLGKP